MNKDICDWYTLIGNGCESCPYFIDGCEGISSDEITLSVDEQGFLQIGREQPKPKKVS